MVGGEAEGDPLAPEVGVGHPDERDFGIPDGFLEGGEFGAVLAVFGEIPPIFGLPKDVEQNDLFAFEFGLVPESEVMADELGGIEVLFGAGWKRVEEAGPGFLHLGEVFPAVGGGEMGLFGGEDFEEFGFGADDEVGALGEEIQIWRDAAEAGGALAFELEGGEGGVIEEAEGLGGVAPRAEGVDGEGGGGVGGAELALQLLAAALGEVGLEVVEADAGEEIEFGAGGVAGSVEGGGGNVVVSLLDGVFGAVGGGRRLGEGGRREEGGAQGEEEGGGGRGHDGAAWQKGGGGVHGGERLTESQHIG